MVGQREPNLPRGSCANKRRHCFRVEPGRGRNGETERPVSDDYLLVAAKESDDRWRIIRLIWNAHPP